MRLFFIATTLLLGLTGITTESKAYEKKDILKSIGNRNQIHHMLLYPGEWGFGYIFKEVYYDRK